MFLIHIWNPNIELTLKCMRDRPHRAEFSILCKSLYLVHFSFLACSLKLMAKTVAWKTRRINTTWLQYCRIWWVINLVNPLPGSYRVSHIETCFLNWLWGVEGPIMLSNYCAWWLQEVWTFEFITLVYKKVTLAGLNSLRQKRF